MADEEPARIAKIQLHYIKGSDYRETVCHGAIGGTTPQGKIWMAFYSERPPIPRVVEFAVPAPEGTDIVSFNESESVPSYIDTRQGLIRSVDRTAYLDVDVAERIHKWLGDRIAEIKATSDK